MHERGCSKAEEEKIKLKKATSDSEPNIFSRASGERDTKEDIDHIKKGAFIVRLDG